jgi:thiamine-monophosphate kinase
VQEAFITIAECGEFALIAAIGKSLRRNDELIVGIGDDAAVVRAPDGRVVATTDMLIEGTHFRREWSGARDIGGKAAARNLADIAAMGARPTALLVSFAGPGETEVGWVLDLVAGIEQESSAAGAVVAGGDTSSAGVVMLAIMALGDLEGRRPVRRSGARAGDVVAVTGTLGSAAAGLALLRAGRIRPDRPDRGLEPLIQAHRRPHPPYDAGPEAAKLGATSMIDISDGLVADLRHVASASEVQIELRTTRIMAEPVATPELLARAAAALGGTGPTERTNRMEGAEPAQRARPAQDTDPMRWVLTGGDDHALAATFPPGISLPERWTAIGQVSEGNGIVVDGKRWTERGGWEHFPT